MWLIATLVYLCGIRRLYVYCWRQYKDYTINADLLIFLGATIVYGYSTIFLAAQYWQGMVVSAELYFSTSTWLITLMLFFDYLRAYFCTYSLHALHALMQLQPRIATVWSDNDWRQVPIDQVVVGDRIRVVSGETIPVDGVVIYRCIFSE